MARYIDADALLLKKETIELPDPNGGEYHIDIIHSYDVERAPTADVVPKSEVDELQTEKEDLQAKVAKLRKENIELLVSKETDIHISMEKLVKVRTEHPIFKAIEEKVAREIFEEIFTKCVDYNGYIEQPKLAELKKKYT